MAGPEVIGALEAVLERDPRNVSLLLHLAELLLEANRPADALKRCQAALEAAPADPGAIALAEAASQAMGPPDLRIVR